MAAWPRMVVMNPTCNNLLENRNTESFFFFPSVWNTGRFARVPLERYSLATAFPGLLGRSLVPFMVSFPRS